MGEDKFHRDLQLHLDEQTNDFFAAESLPENAIREARRSLKRELRLLQSMIDGARNSHLAYLDRDFNFVHVNEAYAKTCGYRPDELVGKNHFELFPHGENEAIFRGVRDSGIAAEFHDKPFIFPDPTERGITYWDWTLTPVKDASGNVEGLVFSLFETTERKRAEEALDAVRESLELRVKERTEELQQTNERLRKENQERLLTEQSLRLEEARLDALLHLSRISEAPLEEITSFTLEQAISLTNSKIGFLGFLNEDQSIYTLHAVSKKVVKECNVTGNPLQWHVADSGIWADAIREQKTLFVNDYSKPHPRKKGFPPGHPYVERFMVVPILEDNRVMVMAGVGNKTSAYDRSDERQIVLLLSGMWGYIRKNRSREDLQNAYNELEMRTAQLSRLTSELTLAEQRERRRIAEILHDHLQQFLVAAKMHQEIVIMKADNVLKPAAESVLDLINQSIKTSRSLTAELSPSVLRSGNLSSSLEWLSQWLYENQGFEVNVQADPEIVLEQKDLTVLIFQSIRELLFNVAKHAGVKSARVEMSCDETNRLRISVIDQGTGFDPDTIWEKAKDGSGFGLFSIRERIRLLGGNLEMKSSPGSGACFSLVVPVEIEKSHRQIEKHMAEHQQVKTSDVKIRILIADDHTVVRQGISTMLNLQSDIEVIGEASDGEAAIRMARELVPDVILMDINMPNMDGLEATRIIHSEFPQIRIIGLSMFHSNECSEMIEAGLSAYHFKGEDSTLLLTKIRD